MSPMPKSPSQGNSLLLKLIVGIMSALTVTGVSVAFYNASEVPVIKKDLEGFKERIGDRLDIIGGDIKEIKDELKRGRR